MVNRVQRILLALMDADAFVTSAALADAVGVSSRTIKATMPQVAQYLEKHGAELEAKRNRGYRIIVHDHERYSAMRGHLEIEAAHIAMGGYDETSRVLYICRKLVAAPAGAKIDEIADDLCLSRSAVRRPLRQARAFCESYHLKVTSSPGGGVRVYGEERMVRLAMVELFEIHFHKFELDASDREYARWIGCDYQERQDIRHSFLATLRASGISMRDSITQRVAMYLIIVRNRVRAGLNVILPEAWINEIMGTPYYQLACDIIGALAEEFDDFSFGRHEAAFLGMWIMLSHDVNCAVDLAPLAPALVDQVRDTAARMLEMVRDRTGADLASVPGAQAILEHTLMPMLAAHRYEMDGLQRFDFDAERGGFWSPLAVYVGNELAIAMRDLTGCLYALSDVLMYAAMVLGLLERTQFPLKPLRLLITSVLGPEYARIQGENLMRRFPALIASVHPCELYEIRGYDPNEHDAVLTDAGAFSYNYDYPYAPLGIARSVADYGVVHDTVLINAYDLDGLLPPPASFHVTSALEIDDPLQAVNLIRLRHHDDPAVTRALDASMQMCAHALSGQPALAVGGCLYLLAPLVGEGDERFELFRFAAPVRWRGARIDRMIFCIVDFAQGMAHVKAFERALYALTLTPDAIPPLAADILPFVQTRMRELLKLHPAL